MCLHCGSFPLTTAEDCFDLGRIAYNNADYYHTVLWMEQAMDQLQDNDVISDKALLLDYLAFAVYSVSTTTPVSI